MRQTIPHCRSRWRIGPPARGALVLFGALTAGDVAAQGLLGPVDSRNLSPLYGSYGIPTFTTGAIREAGAWELSWSLHWASHAVQESFADRDLEFDGETRRQDLRLAFGVTDSISLELNVPYIEHSPGRLDGLIDGWHAFWGLPDGPREDQRDDALRFSLSGEQGFFLDRDSGGLGDLELGLGAVLLEREYWSLVGVAQLKLPTGDAAGFAGSGDESLAIAARLHIEHCVWSSLRCHLQFGVADIGEVAFTPPAESTIPFAGLALAWRLGDRLALLAQLDTHHEIYNSRPLDANGTPLWGTLGLRWQPAAGWLAEAQFIEDLAVGAAPDISFRFSLGHKF